MVRRLLINLCLFIAIVAPSCIYLSGLDRYPGVLGDKVAFYDEHHDEFDTLIVGSSFMYFGIDPRELDASLKDQGIESRSFNLSIPGILGHEIDELIRLAIRIDRMQRLKRVYIDLRPLELENQDQIAGTEFEVWWHSPYQTWAVIQTIWGSDRSTWDKTLETFLHLRLLVANYLPLGTAHNLYHAHRRKPFLGPINERLNEFRGFEPLNIEQVNVPGTEGSSPVSWAMILQRGRMLSNPERIESERRNLIKLAETKDELLGENPEFWQAQSDRLEARGILGLHIVMPAFKKSYTTEGAALAELGVLKHFGSFNDPRLDPELFTIENRYEFGHLNAEGARYFSRRLGEETAAYLAGNPSRFRSFAPNPGGTRAEGH